MKNAHDISRHSARFALVSLVIGAVMISFSGVWVKVAHVTPNVSAFYRVFFGGIFLLVAALLRREIRWPGLRHLLLCVLCGALFALDLWLYHYAIQFIGPGLGTILPNFQVFILAGIGILFLKEPLRLVYILSLPMAFLGLFMIVGIDWSHLEASYRKGIFYGLACAVVYAGFIISLRRLQANEMGVSFFFVLMTVSLASAFFLGADILYNGDSFWIPDLQSLIALIALALFSQAVGWILITNALPNTRASFTGLILLLQPALAFVWDVLFFNRPTTMVNWLGVLVALAAIYLGMTGPSAGSSNMKTNGDPTEIPV